MGAVPRRQSPHRRLGKTGLSLETGKGNSLNKEALGKKEHDNHGYYRNR
jgi:hypothetical protein